VKLNDCKGCYSDSEVCYFTNLKRDNTDIFNKLPICPCVDCVVKVVCNQPYPEYSDFSNSYFYGKNEEKEDKL
jgi:hypothetical protein